MPEKQKQSTALVWFTKDLRLRDNHSLLQTLAENERTVAAYCFDPRHFAETKYGFKKTEKFRAKFLIETVENLRKNLQNYNITLLVFHEKPEVIFPKIVKKYKIDTIYCQREWTSEEVSVSQKIKAALPDCNFIETYDQFLFHPVEIPFSNFSEIPEVFTDFRKIVEAKAEVRKYAEYPKVQPESNLVEHSTEIPGLTDLGLADFEIDARSAFPFQGGEEAAEERLQHYFWKTQNLKTTRKPEMECWALSTAPNSPLGLRMAVFPRGLFMLK